MTIFCTGIFIISAWAFRAVFEEGGATLPGISAVQKFGTARVRAGKTFYQHDNRDQRRQVGITRFYPALKADPADL